MRTVRFVVCVAFALCPLAAHAASNCYVETFDTDTYKDTANTTALWDMGTGELKLPPFAISLAGGYDTPGNAYDVAFAGNLAFVADLAFGLQILDITDPASPTLLGTYDTPGSAAAVAVTGDWVLVADYASGMLIVDVSNPASPTLVGSYDTPGSARGVAVDGDFVYVADLTSGLQIISIANPASPTLVGTYDTPGHSYGVVADGDLVFVADWSGGLRIIDVSNPAAPTLAGTYASPTTYGIDVDGDHVFLGCVQSGLLIVDVSNPATPVLLGTYDTPSNAYGVSVNGDIVLVADDVSGLQIVDVTNPASPTLSSSYDSPGNAYGVAPFGNLAFVSDSAGGVQVIEVMANALNYLVGTCATPSHSTDVKVKGDLAYVADNTAGLQIVDISNPAVPAIVGTYNTPGNATEVVVKGDLAFVSDSASGLQIIDVSNPAAPLLVGMYDTVGSASGVAVEGDLAFVSDGASGLQIIGVSNPAAPLLVGTYDTVGFASAVVVTGDLAIVADGAHGLHIINISSPASPTLVGSYDPGNATDLVAVGDLLVVAGLNTGLHIVDITNPASPSLVSTYDPPGSANAVVVEGDFLFVTDDSFGLHTLDIANPANPTLIGTFGTGAFRVATAGELAFVLHEPDGLQVVRVFDHLYDTWSNVGQSLAIDDADEPILRARLSSAQTAGVMWELCTDSLTTWLPIVPNNAWTLLEPGNDLVWRSKHTAGTGFNPSVSDLQIEWLYDHAMIKSVADVPDDQGGRVYIELHRSGHDFADEGFYSATTQYGIYRRVDEDAVAAMIGARAATDVEPAHDDPLLPGVETLWVDGTKYVLGSTPLAAAAFPTGTWALVATIPATQNDNYIAEATTTADSSSTGTNTAEFVVTTHTAIPAVWFISPTESGYSVDNIAPAVPANFAVAYFTGSGNTLSWNPSPDSDFQYFRVYRANDPSFTPSPGSLVHATTTTDWADPEFDGWTVYYKVTALDHAGNESEAAEPGSVTAVDDGVAPRSFALHLNVPNPFNPTTKIRYDVPEHGGMLSLRIYDVGGNLVRTLVEGVQPAGTKEVSWNGRDDRGYAVASGVYFYRMASSDFVQTRKMVLVK